MASAPAVRPLARDDRAAWLPLWAGYNAFYQRAGPTALDPRITEQTWERFFDPASGLQAHVAELDGRVVGLVHCVIHRSTTRLADVCYLQDLFTEASCRGRGVGRALIQRVIDVGAEAGHSRVYWSTHTTNTPGRLLYDQMAENRGFILYSRELGHA